MHPTVAANQQHRHDPHWRRTRPGRYENNDGWAIVRGHNRGGWRITRPDGTETGPLWPTLVAAKHDAARRITKERS